MKESKKRPGVQIDQSVIEKYAHGSTDFNIKKMKYKSLKMTMRAEQERVVESAEQTAITEVLLPSTEGSIQVSSDFKQKIYKLKQDDISQQVDLNTASNRFDLQLHDFGPYKVDYSRNGRYLLFGGRRGHVAILDCHGLKVGMELQLGEEVHDVHYLQNESMFAVAQTNYTYIYDFRGTEIHSLRNHDKPLALDYLPYHFLLTSTGATGWLRWQDVSTGEYAAGFSTGHGPCNVLRHNPQTAVSHLGHRNGVVTLWSPNTGKALISMFCHKSPLADLAVDREGRYMATAGFDGLLKVWDLRTYRSIHGFKLDHPAKSLDISEKGLLAMAIGRTVQVLHDPFTRPAEATYLKHEIRTPNASLSSGAGAVAATNALKSSVSISSVRFRPLEDLVCAGHSHGITTMIVPGAGEPNFDAFENNPFITKKQQREAEIQALLNKLSRETIGLDGGKFVGTVDKDEKSLRQDHAELFRTANADPKHVKPKNKMRGKNKIAARLRRKQVNVMDEQTVQLREKLEQQRQEHDARRSKSAPPVVIREKKYDPLARFADAKTSKK